MAGPRTFIAPNPEEDPKIGMVLHDRYRIIRKLGEGGMGVVYEGLHEMINRRVAIKCLHAQFAQMQEVVDRFHREALAATSIGHQNIIEVTDMGTFPDGTVFMVLEFLEGRDWGVEIENEGPQSLGKTVKIITQVCDALAAAHEKEIVHRDLKPDNIYLTHRGENNEFVKVLDFGISKIKGGPGGVGGITRTGATLGTPHFMAPEQAQGAKDVDHRADIYSLGVIMFQALTNQYPFDADSFPALVIKICSEPAPSVRLYRPDLPEQIEQIVNALLAKNPAERYQDCAALKAALAPFKEMDETPVLNAEAPSTASLSTGILPGSGAGSAPGLIPGSTPGSVPGVSQGGASGVAQPGSKLPMIGMAVVIVLLLVGAIAVGGTLLATNSGGNGQRTAAPTPPPPAKLPPTVPEKAPPAEKAQPVTPPEAEKTVTVKIMTEPDEAELYLDGDRIPNPFDGELPVSTEPRSLEARHSGYTTYIQDLTLRYAQRVRIRLERGSGTDDRRASRRTKTKRPTAETPTKTDATSTAKAPEKTPPTDPTPAKTPAKQPSGTGLKSITLDPSSSKQPSRRELKGITLQ